jgi:hypothetical protein
MKRLAIAVAAALLTVTASMVPAASAEPRPPTTAEIKEYAENYVISKSGVRQWGCFVKVINYESTWNYKAQNGIYYGLGQIANAKKRHVNRPYKQVRDSWKYMVHRYKDRACGAWSHIKRVGWH